MRCRKKELLDEAMRCRFAHSHLPRCQLYPCRIPVPRATVIRTLRASVRRHRSAPQPERASDRQEHPEAGSCQPAMMDVIDLAGDLRHSIETRNQIHACLALQWDETRDETPLERRFGRRHEDRRRVWWLSPDDRKWLRFPDRYHCQPSLFQQGVV